MTWNYRIMRKKCEEGGQYYFAIHEVYYDKNGGVEVWTKNPIFGGCQESPEELIKELNMILNDAEKRKNEILDYDAEPTYYGALALDWEDHE
jgi:hypothetical protein